LMYMRCRYSRWSLSYAEMRAVSTVAVPWQMVCKPETLQH